MRLALLLLVFVAFTAFSTWVTVTQGYFGFLHLAMRERWMVQVLMDLALALAVAWAWLLPDARARGLPGWPYAIATLGLGSIAVLAYLVHRELSSKRATPRQT